MSIAAPAADDAVEVLLRFGTAMLRAGNTAFRTREWLLVLARKLGFDEAAVDVTFDSVTVSVRRDRQWTTMLREVGPPGVNVSRIGELERLANALPAGSPLPEVAERLDRIEATPHFYAPALVATAVGLASGAFAFLNGCPVPEIATASLAGGLGQWSRSWLARRHLNQYGVAAAAAAIASGLYVLIATFAARAGVAIAGHPAGFISSVLFLIPGVPLVAALLDLLERQTVAGVSRMAYGMMIFLTAVFGLSIVVGIAKIDLSPQPAAELAYPVHLLLRAVASFVGGCGFAMLFNNSMRTVIAVGLLALVANELRLGLRDLGMLLAPASFFGALAAGLLASPVRQRLAVPRFALTVPAIIIMVPGVYAFEMIVFFNRGQMLEALQAAAACGFATGALAIGLAAARLMTRQQTAA